MPKIAIICDTHGGVRNDSPFFHDYLGKCYKWFFDEVENRGIKDIIHLGDLFDRRKYVSFLTAYRTRKDFLEPVSEKGLSMHIIAGNHDIYYKNANHVNALDELVTGRYPTIKTYTAPEVLNYDGTLIQLIPWILDSNFAQSHDAIAKTKAEIVMGHFEMDGFELLRGIKSEHGDKLEIFKRFDMVFSGHYHHKSTRDNFHYLGAFAEYTWSDFNDPRGITIFDTATRKFEFVRNPHVMYKMIAYDDVKYPTILDKIREKDYSEYKDCYVRIVSVNRTNPYAFDFLMDKLYKVSPADISIIEDTQSLADIAEEGDGGSDTASQDTTTLLDSYIDNLTLTVDNARMKTYMKDVYKEALSI